MYEDRRRIGLGVALGIGMGVLYGTVANLINVALLPGVPLWEFSSGGISQIALTVIAAALLGFVSTAPDEGVAGIFWGGFTAALLTSLIAANAAEWNMMAVMMLFVYTFLPRAVLFAPAAALIRWVSENWFIDEKLEILNIRKKAISVGLVVVISLGGGLFSLYPQQSRQALASLNQTIQDGRRARTVDELPRPLLSVDGFLERGQGSYTMELIDEPDQIPVQRRMVRMSVLEPAIIVRFDNGFRFGCVFTPPYPEPACKNY